MHEIVICFGNFWQREKKDKIQYKNYAKMPESNGVMVKIESSSKKGRGRFLMWVKLSYDVKLVSDMVCVGL